MANSFEITQQLKANNSAAPQLLLSHTGANVASFEVGATGNMELTTTGGTTNLLDTTESDDLFTGAEVIDGGLAVKKKLNVGGATRLHGNLVVNGSVNVDGELVGNLVPLAGPIPNTWLQTIPPTPFTIETFGSRELYTVYITLDAPIALAITTNGTEHIHQAICTIPEGATILQGTMHVKDIASANLGADEARLSIGLVETDGVNANIVPTSWDTFYNCEDSTTNVYEGSITIASRNSVVNSNYVPFMDGATVTSLCRPYCNNTLGPKMIYLNFWTKDVGGWTPVAPATVTIEELHLKFVVHQPVENRIWLDDIVPPPVPIEQPDWSVPQEQPPWTYTVGGANTNNRTLGQGFVAKNTRCLKTFTVYVKGWPYYSTFYKPNPFPWAGGLYIPGEGNAVNCPAGDIEMNVWHETYTHFPWQASPPAVTRTGCVPLETSTSYTWTPDLGLGANAGYLTFTFSGLIPFVSGDHYFVTLDMDTETNPSVSLPAVFANRNPGANDTGTPSAGNSMVMYQNGALGFFSSSGGAPWVCSCTTMA